MDELEVALGTARRSLRSVPRHGRVAWQRGCKPSPTRYGGSARNFRRRLMSWWIGCGSTMSARTRPSLGETMPNFVLPDETGQLVSLDSLLEKGPVAVTFHRGHWCPYCRINTRALAEAQDQIAAEGGQVAAIMPDREHFTAELKAESEAPFPILTDFDNGYALSLNLAFWVGQEMQEADDARRLGRVALARQRHLAAAGPRHLRRRHQRRGEGALRRSRLPQAHDHRGSACRRSGPRIRRRRSATNRKHAASSSWPKPRPCVAARRRRKD